MLGLASPVILRGVKSAFFGGGLPVRLSPVVLRGVKPIDSQNSRCL